jgi:hypothetical protein
MGPDGKTPRDWCEYSSNSIRDGVSASRRVTSRRAAARCRVTVVEERMRGLRSGWRAESVRAKGREFVRFLHLYCIEQVAERRVPGHSIHSSSTFISFPCADTAY